MYHTQITENKDMISGVFKGEGNGAMPPIWPDHENFLPATLYQIVRFLPFPARTAKFSNV